MNYQRLQLRNLLLFSIISALFVREYKCVSDNIRRHRYKMVQLYIVTQNIARNLKSDFHRA